MPRGGARPGAGRKAGVPTRKTLEITEKLAKLGCDPIIGMARIALDKKNPLELRGRMFSELAQYVAPKRRAVEHSADKPTLEALLGRLAEEPED